MPPSAARSANASPDSAPTPPAQQQLEAQERTRQAEQAARDISAAEKERMREQQRQAAEERRQLERSTQQEVAAARTVYGGVRDQRFFRDDGRLQVRVGEALAVSHAMREFDPLATTAHDYLRREITHRYGDDATAWMLAAMAAYREELDRLHDVDHATTDADQHQQRAYERSHEARTEGSEQAAESLEIAETERAAADTTEADASAQSQQAAVTGGQREHAAATTSDLEQRDPEAHQVKETTGPAYPIADYDNMRQRHRTPPKGVRRAAITATDRTSGR